jgi:hypothetical protein
MQPPSAQSQAFDTTCSAWLDCWVDTIPLGRHRLLSDFLLLQLSAARSLQRLELIHHSRNKLRHCGMNVHRALYHCVGRLGVHDIEYAMDDLVTMLLRLAPCAWALSPAMVASDNPSSATTAIYATATDAFMCRAV